MWKFYPNILAAIEIIGRILKKRDAKNTAKILMERRSYLRLINEHF